MNVYCVILCRLASNNPGYPRIKRFYLRSDSADMAIHTATHDNPQWRAVGIEPAGLSAPAADKRQSSPVRTTEYPGATQAEGQQRAS